MNHNEPRKLTMKEKILLLLAFSIFFLAFGIVGQDDHYTRLVSSGVIEHER